jgi:hypothetical protein
MATSRAYTSHYRRLPRRYKRIGGTLGLDTLTPLRVCWRDSARKKIVQGADEQWKR